MRIDSVKINGAEVDVNAYTYTSSDNGVDTRVNLYNEWVNVVEEGRTLSAGDEANVTPTPISKEVGEVSSIEVTFTLMENGVPFVLVEEEYTPPSEFTAFMMFQDNGGGQWSIFNMDNGNEVTILGDGVWTITLTRDQAGGTGQAIPDEDGLVFLVDINELGKAMTHVGTMIENDQGQKVPVDSFSAEVEVYIDGNKVTANNGNLLCADTEGNGRLRLEMFNTWGPDGYAVNPNGTRNNPVVQSSRLTPENEITVVVTLKGTGFNSNFDWSSVSADEGTGTTDAVTLPATVDPTPAPAASGGGSDDGGNPAIIIAIVVVVVAAVACVAVVVLKKKKAAPGGSEEK
jgi:hypothetical protein